MLDASHTNSPNTSMQPMVSPAAAASHSTSLISDGSSRESKRAKTRTGFYTVAKKVLDEMNNEEIEPEIEDESKAGYFSPDPEVVEEDDEATIIRKSRDRIASSAYEIFFKPGVFVKFFLMHILFFFVFGPFIFLLAPIFGKYVLINQGFMGINQNFFIQSIQYAALVSFLISYYLAPIKGLQAMEVYMICIAVLVRLITISSKYAYQSESFLKLLHTTKLTPQDSQGDLILFGWRLQHDVVIEEELQAAILRLEIDSSLFFFNFLGKTSLKLKESLSKHKMIGRLTAHEVKTLADGKSGEVESGNFVTFSNRDHHTIALESSSPKGETVRNRIQTSAREILASERKAISKSEEVRNKFKKAKAKIEEGKKKEKITKTAQEIFKSFSHFMGTKKLEKSHLYGYNLAFDMIKYVRDLRYRYLGTTLMIISIIRAMIPTFYRMYLVYRKKEDIPIFTAKPFVVVILFISNSLFFWFNSFILSVPILDTYSKTVVFKQIGYLISPRKIAEFKDRKLYPTLNIFDPVTLKTWSNFRRLMNSYGRKYTLRSNFNVTITMIVYSIVLGILILQATGLVNTYNNPLLLVILSYETVVFFTIFILIMLGGAFVNNQYRVHKNLLKKNKTIISDFQQLSYLYVGREAIEPDNYIYKEGLKLLRAELGRGDNEEDFEEKLIARSEKLSTMIDDIIEELDFEEENEPFTVLGVPITYGILKSLAAGVASLGFALSQMVMS